MEDVSSSAYVHIDESSRTASGMIHPLHHSIRYNESTCTVAKEQDNTTKEESKIQKGIHFSRKQYSACTINSQEYTVSYKHINSIQAHRIVSSVRGGEGHRCSPQTRTISGAQWTELHLLLTVPTVNTIMMQQQHQVTVLLTVHEHKVLALQGRYCCQSPCSLAHNNCYQYSKLKLKNNTDCFSNHTCYKQDYIYCNNKTTL